MQTKLADIKVCDLLGISRRSFRQAVNIVENVIFERARPVGAGSLYYTAEVQAIQIPDGRMWVNLTAVQMRVIVKHLGYETADGSETYFYVYIQK